MLRKSIGGPLAHHIMSTLVKVVNEYVLYYLQHSCTREITRVNKANSLLTAFVTMSFA